MTRATIHPDQLRLNASSGDLDVELKKTHLGYCLRFVLCFHYDTAYGYTDPNTVGLISQILTPLVITAGATLTFLRKRIATALSGLMQRLRGKADVSQG